MGALFSLFLYRAHTLNFTPYLREFRCTWISFFQTCMTSIGFGNVAAETDSEKIFCVLMMVVSSLLYAAIFGHVTTIIHNATEVNTYHNVATFRKNGLFLPKWDLGTLLRTIIILFLLIATVQQLNKYYIWPHAFITTSFLLGHGKVPRIVEFRERIHDITRGTSNLVWASPRLCRFQVGQYQRRWSSKLTFILYLSTLLRAEGGPFRDFWGTFEGLSFGGP